MTKWLQSYHVTNSDLTKCKSWEDCEQCLKNAYVNKNHFLAIGHNPEYDMFFLLVYQPL